MSFLAWVLSLVTVLAQTSDGSYAALKREAESAFAEKSFARAHSLYEQAAKVAPREERRWVELRLADTDWRANTNETREEARAALEKLIRESPEHDRTWAEANESLADYHAWHSYQPFNQWYTAALDWWAGSSELDLARQRYLSMVWRIARAQTRWNPRADENPHNVPRDVLVNAIAIANTVADRNHARYLLAQQYLGQRSADSVERAYELFEQILADGKKSEYYDDALFLYASSLASTGAVYVNEDRATLRTDFRRALELYRRLVAEFQPGQSKWVDDARRAIENITGVSVGIDVGRTFLPDSEQEIHLTWRNVQAVEVTIAPTDLTRKSAKAESWLTEATGAPVRQWTEKTNDSGEHLPTHRTVRITPRLETGAYVVTARAGGKTERSLLLVTDLHVLVHHVGGHVQAFVSHVLTGEPVAGARVAVNRTKRDNTVDQRVVETNASGIADAGEVDANGSTLIAAAKGARQAFHALHTWGMGGRYAGDAWRIYAFTDRPAYRPLETVQWKMIARRRANEQWATPAGQTLTYEIVNPREEKVAEGKATLNAFGSFWGELPLSEAMPLGTYVIRFRASGESDHVGAAELFRLEEYKLPEFRVDVRTPEGKQYRTGDTIEAEVEASYYFGGPVANATVEVVVWQEPFVRYWMPWREYPWYFEDQRAHHGGGTIVKRETVKTDATGRATVSIETARDRGDLSYRIEARVVDASRREVTASGNVRVTRQRYSVSMQPQHYLHRPGERVSIAIKAVDANDRPVRADGTVTVRRSEWREKERRYETEKVEEAKVSTDAKGEATFTFTPRRDGYYQVEWTSQDRLPGEAARASGVVRAQTTVWVSTTASTNIGYRASGIELIVDKEAFRAGTTAPVMIVTPNSGRWVVLTASASGIIETQVLRLDGNVKLVQLPLDQRHVPNFFLTASSVFDRAIATVTRDIVVPPVEQFVTVDVKPDREQYEPREKGMVTITTRDADGKPVAAEVALAVSDESVTAIQRDLAGDPRQFFFGERRHAAVQVTGSLHSQQYVRLVEDDGVLYDDRYPKPERRAREEAKEEQAMDFVADNLQAGGVVGQAAPPPAPVPTAAPPRDSAVAEAITVTASAPEVQSRANATGGGAATDGQIEVVVRSDFRSTAFWKPDIVTDANGTATVEVTYPEALTTWRATARAVTRTSQFGMASATARTNLPLLVRLQAPRFFVAGDRVTVSAVINNNTDAAMQVTPTLEVEGLRLDAPAHAPVTVPPHAEARADWSVVAEKAGTAKLKVTGRSAARGDAMERTLTVFEHGIDKLIARSGKLRGEEAVIKLDLPRDRRATELIVRVQPTLAAAMFDALPYLLDFPYGCTEQTMSRFLPAAIVARTLAQSGAEFPIPRKRLDEVTAASMARLYDFQHDDGSWGWWKEGESDLWMTAYVVWGFAIARDGGLPVRKEAVDRAHQWMVENLAEIDDNPHDLAWALHAMAAWRKGAPAANVRKAFDAAYGRRAELTAYSRALLALAAHDFGLAEAAKVLVRNLENGVKIDRTPDSSVLLRGETAAETMATAHWGADRFWWRWWDSPVETTAFVLQTLVTIDPKHELIEPAMNWLVKNRRGARWNNTRDTAISILALNDYLKISGELSGDIAYEVTVNGTRVSGTAIDPALVRDANEIRIRRTGGRGPIYFATEARFVSLEEPVKAAGNEIFVRREYFRLVPRPTLLKGVVYDQVPLRDGESIRSGERLEVVATIDAKNDYEYLLFEDLKPAGFEAIALQSGQPLYATGPKGETAYVYQELRDRKVALFIDRLSQGLWTIRYPLRAEVPGAFHALPLLGGPMYVPDVRGNGDEQRVEVRE